MAQREGRGIQHDDWFLHPVGNMHISEHPVNCNNIVVPCTQLNSLQQSMGVRCSLLKHCLSSDGTQTNK